MRAMDLVKTPWWMLDIALGGKSFRDNGLIGSKRLNERGFHIKRIELAERMAISRRRGLTQLLEPQDRAAFEENGFILRHNALPEQTFKRLLEQVEDTPLPAREMKQGGTVTRFIPVGPEQCKKLSGLGEAVALPLFQGGLRYVASRDAEPMVYLHTVLSNPEQDKRDPQTHFHSDTFFPTAKAWLFLKDVEMEDGPFHYVPGSHRLTSGRRKWEYEQSLIAAEHKNKLHAVGSFRASLAELERMGFGEPVPMNVPANTLVIADTHGFHARGISTRPCVRLGLYGSLRRNPYAPWVGMDLLSLPPLGARQAHLSAAHQNLVARLKGKAPSLMDVGEVRASAAALR
ncbi:phytanoyl-CoA dioxygenase [Rhodobacteraceae bacterium RKSG542]|uniref:phytanoyl-CoA dioxygenase family protein n=1 Tax=Pseudovibrio flavus TaxID=2529854 RepID=UPI0012BBC4C4|nr:phytanoyl-CoA dioxygenase family protein [Pseudovibrio flavus]MTI19162.1 phytanoyl-CoA dioxygenase [Pseudovibrio flavus]